jgi:hypothetical protein
MAFATQHRTTDFRLERYLVVLAAVVANDLKASWRVFAFGCLFCPALRAPLRCHQVFLVKDLLLFLGKEKGLLALYADGFNIRHRANLLVSLGVSVCKEYSTLEKRFT